MVPLISFAVNFQGLQNYVLSLYFFYSIIYGLVDASISRVFFLDLCEVSWNNVLVRDSDFLYIVDFGRVPLWIVIIDEQFRAMYSAIQ